MRAHGAHRRRRADAFGDLRIGGGGASRNLAQRFPHAALEGGAAHIQRQVQAQRRVFDEAHHLGHPAFELGVGADQAGLAEAFLQAAHQVFGVFV